MITKRFFMGRPTSSQNSASFMCYLKIIKILRGKWYTHSRNLKQIFWETQTGITISVGPAVLSINYAKYCLVSISWIVFIKRKSGRISALWWYLIMTYQNHNNKDDHLTRPWEGPGLNAWVFRYPTHRSSNKQLLLWKISSADNQGLPLCWLT